MEWKAFYDEHLRFPNLIELITHTDEDLDAVEKAQGEPLADTAEPFSASSTQKDELSSDVPDDLGALRDVVEEHLAPQGQGHPELMDLSDEALKGVHDFLDKVLSGQAPEALPTDGRGGGEGSMLLRSLTEVINRFAQITCVYSSSVVL